MFISPPIGAVRNNDTCPFEDLQSEIISRRCTGRVSICGDFNSRTAETRDINLDTNFPEHVQFSETTLTRLNVDKITNTYGRKLIDLCRNHDMVILNGRARCKGANKNSPYTGIRHNGSSVVDYVITQLESLKTVRYFKVLEKLVESDHTPLTVTLNIKLAKQCANQKREI